MKRVLSLFLTLVMIVGIIGSIPVNVSATNSMVENAINWAVGIANDNNYGYSQVNRYGNPDYDCSSLVSTAFHNAGFNVACELNTYTMKDAFVNAGFTWIPASQISGFPSSCANLQRGDILLATSHTELYIGDGKNVGAHMDYNGIPGGIGGGSTWSSGYNAYRYGADEIDVCNYWNDNWLGVLRYGGSSSNPGTSTTYNYQTITAGSYYVKSNGQSTYNYLTVSETSANSGAAVNAWSFMTISRVQIANNGGKFYTMKFPDITTANAVNVHTSSTYPTSTTKVSNYKYSGSTTQSWGFDKVSGGYVIRCKANENMVLTCNGSGQATISAYSAGNANQIWSLIPYVSGTVKYDANGGSGAPSSQTKYFNQALTLSSTKPTRSGYTFMGWGTSSSDTSPNYYAGSSYNSESGITLYAIWDKGQTTYTIKYNANGGSGAPANQTKPKGTTITLSTKVPERFGYTFIGWGTTTDATSGYYPGGNFSKNANTTLYANWKSAVELSEKLARRTGTITYEFANAYKYYKIIPKYNRSYRFESTGSLDTQIFIYNSSGTLLASDDNSGSGNNYKLDYTVSAGQTYYIKQLAKSAGTSDYSFLMKYSIKYNANGGTGAPSTQTKLYGKDIILSSLKPTREGYSFLGWATSSDATVAEYNPGATYTNNSGLKLYAVWKAANYKVTFNANGGSCSTSNKSVTYNSTYGTLPTPTRSGYNFAGWYTAQNGGTKITSSTKYTTAGATTLYAHWTQNHTHSYTGTVTKAPTCTQSGVKTFKCSCGASYTQTISATGHTEVKDQAIAATCTKAGKTQGSHCSVCNTVIKAQTVISATGHQSEGWWYRNATVYENGVRFKICDVCNEEYEVIEIPQLKCKKPSLKKIANTADGVKITWGSVKGADSYTVYRKTGSSGEYTKIGETSKTYYTDKKAKSGKEYYYNIKAVNEAGTSSASSSKSILYLADTTLSTPKSTKSGITLKWKKVTGAEGYQVYRKTGSGSYSKIATVKGSTKVSYTDKKAKKGKTYTYKIKAYKSKTTSAYSNAKKIKDKY